MSITWKEFKNVMDNERRKLNIPDDAEIDYIDVFHPCWDHPSCIPEFFYDKDNNEISIFN